jgi:RNA polymerase sigma factor (sigma-70 family)
LERPIKRGDSSRNSTLQETLADHQETVEQVLIKEAGIDAVRNCIDALAQEEERQAIALYYLVGKVYREIGEILGRSTSTAKNYVTSAREKVKHCLEGKGW